MNDSEWDLLTAWLEAAGADGQDADHKARELEKFLRELNKVKAVVWSEGYSDGWLDAQDDTPHEAPNPYEEEEL